VTASGDTAIPSIEGALSGLLRSKRPSCRTLGRAVFLLESACTLSSRAACQFPHSNQCLPNSIR
jgi:hypothetical protein